MIKVYIASPYTNGDQAANVRKSMDAASTLIDLGFCPLWPLHQHFLHMVHPKSYEVWMGINFAWIDDCQAMLRLPGESEGATREVEYAGQIAVPVFTSISDLLDHYRQT